MLGWLLAASLAVSPQAPEDATASAVPMPAPEEVMAVPAELQARLDLALAPADAPARERLGRLVHFMFDEAGLGLRYRDDATHTVAQAFVLREANCLTWTLVLLALAPQAGLVAHPQEINQTVTWHQQAQTIYLNSHVNAVVETGQVDTVVDVSGDELIAIDAPVAISRQRLLSHFYNNRAIALLTAGDTRGAAAYSAQAIALAPDNADHWSNSGVVRVRDGDLAGAVAAYTRALSLDPRNGNALFNSVMLAQRVGDRAGEAQLRARLERVRRKDPLHQFLRGLELEHQGAHMRAIAHYRQAARLRPREHRFHAALARACQAIDDLRCASWALGRARAHSEGDTRAGYQAQLQQVRAARHLHAAGGSEGVQR